MVNIARRDFSAHEVYPDKWMPEAANLLALKLEAQHPEGADDLKTTIIPIALRPTENVDVTFVIDTTGSMGDDIANAQASINQVTEALFGLARSPRVSLVDYKDVGDPYRARVVQPFTADKVAFKAAVNSLTASGGGDTPESVYSGLMTAFDLDWRNGALKLAITIGDAPAHDPESGTGFTAKTVLDKAFALDPVVINPIVVSGDAAAMASFKKLAEGSKGKVFTAAGANDVVQAIKDAATNFSLKPVATLAGPYTAGLSEPIAFSAAGSFDPEGAITHYAWDFNSDGKVDAEGTSPVAIHKYSASYTGLASVTVTATDGEKAVGTAEVTVAAGKHVPRPPTKPLSVTAKPNADGSVVVSWKPPTSPGDAPIGGYRVYREDDVLLGMTEATNTSVTIKGAPAGRTARFKVEAVNIYGPSERAISGPVDSPVTTTSVPTSTTSITPVPSSAPQSSSSAPVPQGRTGGLAFTGAAVLWLIVAALVLVGLGVTLFVAARRRRRRT